MKIGSINSNNSFRAKISQELSDRLEQDRLIMYTNPHLRCEDEGLYMKHYFDVRSMFPEGELCLDENDKSQLVLTHEGKEDIPLGKLPEPCSMSVLAKKMNDTMANIAKFLK